MFSIHLFSIFNIKTPRALTVFTLFKDLLNVKTLTNVLILIKKSLILILP